MASEKQSNVKIMNGVAIAVLASFCISVTGWGFHAEKRLSLLEERQQRDHEAYAKTEGRLILAIDKLNEAVNDLRIEIARRGDSVNFTPAENRTKGS